MPLLSVKNLGVILDGNEIVKDISFDVEDGESLAIIGPNGSGKTVLLKALLGILPHTGEVEWRPGTSLGYVPQKIDADRRVPLNVLNLLESKAHIIGKGKEDINKVIKEVSLTKDILGRQIGHLSGGQFQRALIAFALLGQPDMVLFDEPTASIDEPGEEQMYELIHRLQDDLDISVIVVSHDLSFVYRYATKVLCLSRTGLCFGTPEEVLTPANLKHLFGGHQFYHHIHPHKGSEE